ncbi:unnamed protein product [Ostreobium quekettii]|uniref:Eukaryotic translation initiation factor 3 subunit B n=1 Tax=Ostreobium quekettii TaxID=121088 RepID=A0A8S1J3P4_9CHLO|nr:unnamed protein product [Ostreobium quekettii]
MTDKYGRDQFVIRFMDDTEIYWNDGKTQQPDMVYERRNWTESGVQWSPYGSYLATLHRQGVAIWGGTAFKQLQKFAHPDVRRIDFSPNEKFLVTSSITKDKDDRLLLVICVFDVRTGQKLRQFEGYPEDFLRHEDVRAGNLVWPIFKWAGGKEDLFFAKLATSKTTGQAVISVYECPDMGLLDKKSLKLDAVEYFEWSPSEPLMSIYHRESQEGNIPAKISLMQLPERKEIRQKNLFNVSSIEIFWHPQGDFLAVKVDRHTKTKKTIYTSFELFCIRERDIPMEVLELPNKTEKVLTFSWEPEGHRFVIVHGEGPRYNVSFYSMKDEKGRLSVKLLGSLKDKHCNAIFWSPKGKNVVLAGLKTMNGQFEFFNVDFFETMGQAEHFMATEVEWDPAGLFLATSVTAVHQMENGFNMWTFQGRNLYRLPRDRFFQFSWRPRAASLLTAEQNEAIRKNLPDKIKEWDREHVARAEEANREVLEKRQRLRDEWKAWVESTAEWVAQQQAFKKEMMGNKYAEREFKMVEVTLTETISVQDEIYKEV